MLFTSFQYAIFLPIVVLLYWILPVRLRLPMLLLASYFFYMSWVPAFILLVLAMTVFNHIWAGVLYRSEDKKKLYLGIGIVVNLLFLAYFKYADFAVQSAASLFNLVTHQKQSWAVDILLPLGISFFTFEFIHYLFEIYRGNKPIKSFVLFALFAAFFPTQIAGPIKRYPDFQAQMEKEQKLRLSYFDEGIPLIVIGVAKKVLLADNLAVLVDMMSQHPGAYGAVETWIFAYAFAFQIYFDFSGYTDIARGSAMLFGYHIPINFNMPYIANNVSDFWRRWHISLSSWLRDYLYIPLGGSRNGSFATNRNLLLTMALGGLWHGASWNFVVWGVFHGSCLIIHRLFSSWRESNELARKWCATRVFHLLSILLTFHVVCIAWVFFRMQDIRLAGAMVKKMIFLSPTFSPVAPGQFLLLRDNLPVVVPVVLIIVAALLLQNLPISFLNGKQFFKKMPAPLKALYCTLLILAIVTFLPDSSTPFIYFQF